MLGGRWPKIYCSLANFEVNLRYLETSGKVCPAVRDHRSTPTELVIDAY
jgi:hypothetical protein